MQKQTLKVTHAKALAILLGIIVGLGLWLVWINQVMPFCAWIDGFMSILAAIGFSIAANAASWMTQILNYVKANPVPSIVGIISVGGGVYGIISKLVADKARVAAQTLADQKISDTQQALLQVSQAKDTAQTQVQSLTAQLQNLQNDPTVANATAQVNSLQTTLAQKEDTIRTLTSMVEDMKQKTVSVVH